MARASREISVVSPVSAQERMLAEVRPADRQAQSGHYVKNEDMKAWLLSWGTDRELLAPKCACSRVHGKDDDDEALCQ